MPYNLTFYKTESATARCLAGTGAETSYTARTQSIIAQRDVDRKALGWAKAAAQSMLKCALPGPEPELSVTPVETYDTEGDKGGLYPTKAYLLTNVGKDELNWEALPGAGWLTLSASSGHLYVGESVTVIVGIDDATLAAGATYNTTLDFINTTNNVGDQALLVQVKVYAIPQVSAAYVSQSGSATLIGISEYTSPSSPPKKYRKQTLSGDVGQVTWPSNVCSGNARADNQIRDSYSGSITYPAAGGAAVNTQKADRYYTPPGTGSQVPVQTLLNRTQYGSTFSPLSEANPFSNSTGLGGRITVSNAQTVKSCIGNPVCDNLTYASSGSGTAYATLSEEDTETDAIARATKTPGTSPTAFRTLRGAGVFTLSFREVAVTLNFTDLQPGKNYQATISLLTENYGGGGGVTTQRTYNFTAAGTTHTLADTVSATSGKQVTASSPTVVRVP